MSCGHLLIIRITNIGLGWRSIEKPEKLLVVILVIDHENQQENYGNQYLVFIDNVSNAYTDFWEAYKTVIPDSRHQPVDKSSGETNHIERLNNTLRQRISRLVRKSLSFSKELDNHIGAIWYFIHHYNDVISNS